LGLCDSNIEQVLENNPLNWWAVLELNQ